MTDQLRQASPQGEFNYPEETLQETAQADSISELHEPDMATDGGDIPHIDDAKIIDLSARRAGRQLAVNTFSLAQRERRKEVPELIAPQTDMSDEETAIFFFGEGSMKRAKQATDLAATVSQGIRENNGSPNNTDARALVLLMRVSSLYKKDDALWRVANKAISEATGLFLYGLRNFVSHQVAGIKSRAGSFTLDDLISEGNIGFLDGMGQFDLGQTSALVTTFCRKRIFGAAVDAVREKSHVVRVSRQYMNLRSAVENGLAVGKSLSDIAEERGMDIERLEEWRSRFSLSIPLPIDGSGRVVSGQAGGSIEGDAEPTEAMIHDPSQDVETQLFGETLVLTDVDKLIASLPERHQQAVRMRFGYPPEKPHSLLEIAARLGVNESRASAILNKSLDNIYRRMPEDMQVLGETRKS